MPVNRKPKDKSPRITTTIENLICREVAGGLHLSAVIDKYKSDKKYKIASETAINRHCGTYPKFKEKLSRAYQALFQKLVNEYDMLSRSLLASNTDDRMEIKRTEVRMKSIEYQLKVVAPILTEFFKQSASELKIEHTGKVGTTIVAVDYSKADVKGALEHARNNVLSSSVQTSINDSVSLILPDKDEVFTANSVDEIFEDIDEDDDT